jgi:hypothetical protein
MADITITKPSRLLEYLPSIYRDSPELGQFLLAFEKVLLGDNDPTLRGIEALMQARHRKNSCRGWPIG